MELDKIHEELFKICSSEEIPYMESKTKLANLLHQLRCVDFTTEVDMRLLISMHRELCKINSRKAIYLEEEIARLILVELPFKIRMVDEEIPKDIIEELNENFDPMQRLALKLSSELLTYGKEIIRSKDDKSKRCKNRIKEALRLLNALQHLYKIKGIKEIFKSKIEDKDNNLQFFALHGLEIYFAHTSADKLTKEEESKLEEIIQSAKKRETASICCQILINAGVIDDFGAIMRIDNWEEKNWN